MSLIYESDKRASFQATRQDCRSVIDSQVALARAVVFLWCKDGVKVNNLRTEIVAHSHGGWSSKVGHNVSMLYAPIPVLVIVM
jgi:hypothetical protein